MSDVSMTVEQFETLANFALAGASDVSLVELRKMLSRIELANGMKYYRLLVRWQESDYPLPAGAVFPRQWPPTLQAVVTRVNQPISKQDVLDMLEAKGSKPSTIMVTDDLEGLVGWSTMERRYG